jgi:hypothetical protein
MIGIIVGAMVLVSAGGGAVKSLFSRGKSDKSDKSS